MSWLISKLNFRGKRILINKSVQKKEKSEVVLLSLGSNLGSKSENIKKAIEFLKERQILEDIQVSSFYETEPVGFKNQPDFLNVAIIGRTNLSADELLHECKNIEKELGRKERPRWHEREIDLDIILYGKHQIRSETLSVPHPQAENRKFVLLPANEIAPTMVFPNKNKTVSELLADCKDNAKVTKLPIYPD